MISPRTQRLPLSELGGDTFLEGRSLVFAVVISFATSMSTFSSPSFFEWLAWAAGNLTAFLVLLIPVWWIWHRRRSASGLVIPWGFVLVISFIFGVSKAALVLLVFSSLAHQAIVIQELFARSLVGGLIGLITLPLLSLAAMALLQVRELNQKLGDRLDVADEIATRPEARQLFEKLLAQINTLLDDLRSGPNANLTPADIKALRELIESGVRPTSHAYWSESKVKTGALGWQRLLELAYGQKIWIWPVLLPLAIGSLVSQVEAFGIFSALQKVGLVTLFSAVSLIVMNRWDGLRRQSAGLWFLFAIALSGPVSWLLAGSLTGVIELAEMRWFVGYTGWLVAGSLFTSAARLLVRERAELSAELDRLRLLDSRSDLEFRREARRKANQIHGEVQSQLVSTALLAENGAQIPRLSLIEQLEAVLNSLEQPEDASCPLEHRFQALARRWSGFLSIEFSIYGAPLSEPYSKLVFSVVEEACLNAYRHGLADECRVQISVGTFIEVSVQDNGVGLRSGSPGLGSALFAEVDHAWSLESSVDGGCLLIVKIVNFV